MAIGGGWGMIFHPEALPQAREGAARLGADAIGMVGYGTEVEPSDIFMRDLPTVRAKAIRLRPPDNQ